MAKSKTYTGTATDLDGRGRGLVPRGDRHIAVPGLLPGERAEIHIEHESRHRPLAFGRAQRRLGPPSPARTEPACPAFGRCGGCSWQHLTVDAQLGLKKQHVERALAAALSRPPAVAAPISSPRTLGYRNKGKYVIAEVAGRLTLGAYAPGSHDVVSTLGCKVVEPSIDRAARQCARALADAGLRVYDERSQRGDLRYAVIRAGADGRVLVCLVTTSACPSQPLAEIADALLASGAASGVAQAENDATSGALFAGPAAPLAGDQAVGEEVAGVRIDVDATSFWQINRAQAARLYEHVAAELGAGPEHRAVDLYGGLGGIAFALTGRGTAVTIVERHRAAVAAARRAAMGAQLGDRVHVHAGTAGDAARLLEGRDIATVNPPRKGLDEATRGLLLGACPPRIAYVSCGPTSLARDLAELSERYRIASVQPFDLMPGTAQIETVVILERR